MEMETENLVALPIFHVNGKVKYRGATATITGCWWDDTSWRYELYIRRGRSKGRWSVTQQELELQDKSKKD